MKPFKRGTKSSLDIEERLRKLNQCRECSVKVTAMDFEEILGKHTKVKIQYVDSPHAAAGNLRLKSNKNGMVLIHRNVYSEHPVKEFKQQKKRSNNLNIKIKTPKIQKNVPEENNNPRKVSIRIKNSEYKMNYKNPVPIRYREPLSNTSRRNLNNSSENKLADLVVCLNESILPSCNWCMDVFPKLENPIKEDFVYEKIAAELENLMNNEKGKSQNSETKADDFPSILDILNDSTTETNTVNNNNSKEVYFGTSDIEAMLLDDSSNNTQENKSGPEIFMQDPGSPSILDGAAMESETKDEPEKNLGIKEIFAEGNEMKRKAEPLNDDDVSFQYKRSKPKQMNVTQVVFKKMNAGICQRSVRLMKTLRYSIELESKPVELLGAPKFVASPEDTKILLQIVNECKLNSSYIWDKS